MMYLNKSSLTYMDRIFINAIIYTIDIKNCIYAAMGIKNGIIKVLGSNEEVMNFADTNTEIIDLNGRCVLPGFIDAYSSIPISTLLEGRGVLLDEAETVDNYISLLEAYLQNHKSDYMIWGIGWKYENEFKHNGCWINKIEAHKPIVLTEYSNEALLLNHEAVNYFKITKETVPPVGGIIEIEQDEYGHYYALLRGNAVNLININRCFKFTDAEYSNELIKYEAMINSYGITTAAVGNRDIIQIPIYAYKNLEQRNMLTARINYRAKILPSEVCRKTVYEQTHEIKRNRILHKTELFDISIGEIDIDGRIELGLAYLFKPYIDGLEQYPEDYRGKFMWHMIELVEAIKMANRLDINLIINARGDYGSRLAMDGIEYSARNNENHNYRNTINHLDLISKYYIRRMKLLNVNALVQPFWFDKKSEANYCTISRIGEGRAYRLYPFKSLIKAGIITASSSDYYVKEKAEPLNAIGGAVCRNLYEFSSLGYPAKVDLTDSKYMLNPIEKVNVFEAVKSFTLNSAYILGMEKETGSLEIGKKADFIVLDDDIFRVPPLKIKDIKVKRTYLAGKLVYICE
ncbi:MAG: amidohydrolase family protein [Clostridium sp.]|nr:amidohydrolase family protein [Clostridium sp.]